MRGVDDYPPTPPPPAAGDDRVEQALVLDVLAQNSELKKERGKRDGRRVKDLALKLDGLVLKGLGLAIECLKSRGLAYILDLSLPRGPVIIEELGHNAIPVRNRPIPPQYYPNGLGETLNVFLAFENRGPRLKYTRFLLTQCDVAHTESIFLYLRMLRQTDGARTGGGRAAQA
jgi:hypothetical protein